MISDKKNRRAEKDQRKRERRSLSLEGVAEMPDGRRRRPRRKDEAGEPAGEATRFGVNRLRDLRSRTVPVPKKRLARSSRTALRLISGGRSENH